MRLSLCIVARNEARFIRASIASARPVVDEVIVVDTGSSDGTPDLARQAGARVVEAEWPGDLGEAHNLPLRFATGDWVLSLDGDEVLDPASRDVVRPTIASGGRRHDGFRVTIRNYDYGLIEKFRRADPHEPLAWGALGYRSTAPVRLFRRADAAMFEGRLHQAPAKSIRRRGGRIGTAPLLIHHYGWLRDDRPRTSFYRALARRQVADRPDDPNAWLEFGVILSSTDPAAGLEAFRCARRLGQRATAAYFIGGALADLGRPDQAIGFLTEAVRGNRRDRSPHFDRADALELLGGIYEALGQSTKAEAAYRRAVSLRSDSPVAQNNLAALLSERGAHRQAVAILAALLERFPGMSMPWATLGAVSLRRSNLDAAQRALERALDIDAQNLSARFNLAVVYSRRGQPRRAARAYAAVMEHRAGDPAARLGLRAPAPSRTPSRLHSLSPGGIVTVIAHLHGGAGRVAVDAVRALRGRQHLVLCGDTGAYTGLAFSAELRALGAHVQTVSSADAVRKIVRQVRPSCVLEHWWDNDLIAGAHRVDDGIPWIAIGHACAPMPDDFDAYVVLSQFQSERQRHLPPDRIYRMSNGVDLRRFRTAGRTAGPVTIAMVSRLERAKFPRRLIDYLPPLRTLNSRVAIAGTGGRRFEIEPDLAVHRLEDLVRFVGVIRPSRMPDFLRRANIGLHLTESSHEVCPLAVLEMLAAGLPIVAEPKGALPELIVPGENGLLGESPDEIAAHLQRLIEEPELRRRMGAASRRMAQNYSLARFETSIRTLVAAVGGDRYGRPGTSSSPGRSNAGQIGRRYRTTPPLPIWRPRCSVFVCGTPRSGSALMSEALWNTGVAGRPIASGDLGMSLSRAGRRGQPALDAADVARAIEERASANGVFAGPFAWQHMQELMRVLATLPDREGVDARTRLRDAFVDPRFVWVIRQDRVEQAVAWVRALQSHGWTTYDAAAIRRRLSELDRLDARWRAFFQSLDTTPIVVHYERLVTDDEATTRHVLSALQLPVPRPLVLGERRLLQQADALTHAWVRRFSRESRGPAS